MTAPLKPTNTASMAVALAGQVRVEINTGDADTPDWTEVRGIRQFGYNFAQNTADDTDVSTAGWASEHPIGNAFTVTVSGLVKGTADGEGEFDVVDPGVQALLDASQTFGQSGVSHIRFWRTDGIDDAFEFYCTTGVSLGDEQPPALQSFSGDLTCKGKPEKITKPTEEPDPGP